MMGLLDDFAEWQKRERTLEAVLEALRVQFTLAEDEVLLRSLAIAAARLAEMEEDDEMVLLLA